MIIRLHCIGPANGPHTILHPPLAEVPGQQMPGYEDVLSDSSEHTGWDQGVGTAYVPTSRRSSSKFTALAPHSAKVRLIGTRAPSGVSQAAFRR